MSDRSPHPIQRGLDLALAVPVAVIGRLRKRLPAIAQHLGNSRAVGKVVVDQGLAKATRAASGEHDAAAPTPRSAPVVTPAPVTEPVAAAPPEPTAIADYASLAASQVVPRLAALTTAELEEIERYESATRKRRTILAAVARQRP